ncbi:hypothetical protein BDD43_2814 [Mucilaginibacter gracilis]|uniref:Uncharacterized protein n=1 Tax=Mucilaginibacter gracilis TaxID=423350 RepID=A0A495J3P2_9SPHI|nr:hypothetical protein [Mucilaginibacter gracilis]RKR82629.1 hypothetical protein BDD43_2814 [Mucilaginibacter gracilis]
MINENTNPEDPENKDRDSELIIPKVPFIELGIDVKGLYEKFIKANHNYDYEFHFDSYEEAIEFLFKVTNSATKPFSFNAYNMILNRIVQYKDKF